jgi:hypothetical protein
MPASSIALSADILAKLIECLCVAKPCETNFGMATLVWSSKLIAARLPLSQFDTTCLAQAH